MAKKKKSFIQTYIEYLLFISFYRLFRLTPLRVAYRLCGLLLQLWFYLDARHRHRAISHILHAGIAKTLPEAVALAKANYNHYAHLLVEIFKADQYLNKNNVYEHFSLCGNQEAIDLFFHPEHPAQAIIVIAHYGNWEIAGAGYYYYTGRKLTSIKRPLNNPRINAIVMQQRERDGHEGVDKNGGLRGMLRALKEGKTIAILADQHAASNEGLETEFFGHPARTHFSPALLHLRTGVPIMTVLCHRIPGEEFKFEYVLGPVLHYQPTDDKEKDLRILTQRYTTELEKLIREEPTQWMWVHRRWLDIDRKRKPSAA